MEICFSQDQLFVSQTLTRDAKSAKKCMTKDVKKLLRS